MKKIKSHKIPAVSIVETITAMLLVFIAFGIGVSIYMNVLRTDRLVARSRAASLLEKLGQQSLQNDQLIDDSWLEGDFRVERTVKPYKFAGQMDLAVRDVYVLYLQAYDPQDQLILEQRRLIRVAKDELQ